MKRFTIAYQHDSMECGVACLQMICNHYGMPYNMGALNQFCHATTEGVSMLGISEAARELGMETQTGKMTADRLAESPLPCILHWNQNHFVVLYKVKKGRKFYVADPALGLTHYDRETFCRHWAGTKEEDGEKGVAMFLNPTREFYKKRIKMKKENHSLKFLMRYFKRYKGQLALITMTLVVGSLLQLVLPFLTQSIVDTGIKERDIDFIWLVLAGQLMLTLSRTVVDFWRRWLLLKVSMRINISLVSDFFRKLLRLPMSFFDTKLMGDLMQRMGDHSRVNTFLTQQSLNTMFAMVTLAVFCGVLYWYDTDIFIIFIIGSLLYGLWMMLFLRKRRVLDYELFARQAENNNKTYQMITSMQEIKLQQCEERRTEEWQQVQADLLGVQSKSLKLKQQQEAGCILINEVKNIVITVTAATAVIQGNLTLGAMLAIQYIIGQLNTPVSQLMDFCYALQDVKLSLERINEIHTAEEDHIERWRYTGYKFGTKEIVVKDVNFKYDPHSPKWILKDINLTIPEGKVTAIVGASGSGKSTLVKLLLQYYTVYGTEGTGDIFLGGRFLSLYNVKWWHQQCGVVMQDGVIFSESIARNIAVSDGEIDEERLMWAAELACIKDFVLSLPLRFNTKIGRDGVGLSQGQKQRILIARAVYKNPDFIFLDEATNSLDAKNEREIVENLEQFYQGKTVVVVAHRLSTVKNADQIVVLDKGQVAEIGTHKELASKHGLYYDLVRNQLELG
ncbi:MAG: peptidase domain-containing ABC transporter [Prevotella sp.]|nr:peptidase domain-containing ABC transporter [Prevotella sp.]